MVVDDDRLISQEVQQLCELKQQSHSIPHGQHSYHIDDEGGQRRLMVLVGTLLPEHNTTRDKVFTKLYRKPK